MPLLQMPKIESPTNRIWQRIIRRCPLVPVETDGNRNSAVRKIDGQKEKDGEKQNLTLAHTLVYPQYLRNTWPILLQIVGVYSGRERLFKSRRRDGNVNRTVPIEKLTPEKIKFTNPDFVLRENTQHSNTTFKDIVLVPKHVELETSVKQFLNGSY